MLALEEARYQEAKNKESLSPEPYSKILKYCFWMKLLQLWIEKTKN